MKISDKLYQKYAVKSPILPEEGEEEVFVSIPKHNKLPAIKDLSEQEMKQWEDFIAEKKLQKDLDVTKEVLDLGGEDKLEEGMGTMPAVPHKKKADLSSDQLLKLCSYYYDLAVKF